MKKCALIVFVFIASLWSLHAQQIKFEHYNDNNGLSQNSVRHIIQDKHGFLWLGTFSGLNRFDGYQFKSFLNPNAGEDKSNSDDITALEYDAESNNLWIGTRKGLTLFEIDSYTFTTYLPDKNKPNGLLDEEIRSVYVDKLKRVWVGTRSAGLFIFYPKENRFEKINIKNFDYVKAIFEDKKGNIWIGSYRTGSVAKINLNSKGKIAQIIKYTLNIPNSNEKNPYLNFIYEDQKSDIFVGTREGLYKLNKTANKFVNLYIENDKTRENLGPYFNTVAQAPDGKYWLGTLGGLIVCDQLEDIAKGNFQWHYAELSDDTSLIDNLVSALYFDYSGLLWIGTEDGLDKYDPYENQFVLNKDISLFIGNKAPRIKGFSNTSDGKIIVATRHDGLYISNNNRFKPLYNNQKDIASIYSSNGKIFYCGLWNGKILVYNYETNSSKEINVGFKQNPVTAFENIGNDKLMVGSNGNGAIVLNTKTLNVEKSISSLLLGFQINRIKKDTRNNIWFATETGIVKYHMVTGKIKEYTARKNDKRGISHNNVSDILFDKEGKLWAATRLGISIYNAALDDFMPLKAPVELVGKWVTDMLSDTNGDIWLNINNNSVARLKSNLKDFNLYHVNSGNRLDIFSSSGFYNFDDSNIYLASKNGIIHFSPYSIIENKWSPKPVITEFKIQNEVVVPGAEINNQIPLTKEINNSNSITLNYVNRNFSIEFSTPSYSNERQNKFEYMLEGFDKKWNITNSSSRTIQYTNLFPGDYVFKVKSTNSDGLWSEVSSYKIKIVSPFWLTYYALILFLGLLYVIFYFTKREIKNRSRLKQELLTEKVNRERDIKLNNEKLRFFTNISHELRTPLTLIIGPAQQLIEEGKVNGTEYQKSRYQLIHQNASRLLNLVNQVLDFRKAQSGELKLKVSKTDILSCSSNIFDSFKEFAYSKNIQLSFNTEDESITGWIDRDKYDKILYNILSNALKFTNKFGHVDLYLRLKNEDYLVIEVSDDGIGIPPKSLEKIFTRFYQATNSKENNTGSGIGLSLVQSLVELHKGSIKVESEINKGSVFTVEIPIRRNQYSKKEVYKTEPSEIPVESENQIPAKKLTKKPATNTQIKEKIVVIEDNIELRKYLVEYLSDYYKVYEAENGKEGLQICRQIKPILCVADIMMPVMNGLEFCKELKNDEFISHIPVILLTALAENEDKAKGYNAGADGYLVKPFDPTLLNTMIVNIIKTRLELKAKFSGEVESEISLLTHTTIDKDLMIKITNLIEENIENIDLTTSFLCSELSMSSSKLYRKIKELTDLAPNEFIRTIRLKKSAQLLKTKKYNVSEVTSLVGFNDPLYFSRCFKKQFGFPPSKLL